MDIFSLNELSVLNKTEFVSKLVLPNSYTVYELNYKNYHELQNLNDLQLDALFVDSGNGELFKSPSRCIHFVRCISAFYSDMSRKAVESAEFLITVKTVSRGNFNVNISPVEPRFKPLKINFDGYDSTLRIGSNRVDISAIANHSRRLVELWFAAQMAERYKPSVIVLDGNLNAERTHESDYINMLFKKADYVLGLSKTCNLVLENNWPLVNHLLRFGPDCPWLYYPLASSNSGLHPADMLVVKLHRAADNAFRLDVYPKELELNKYIMLASVLKEYANDLLFLGYPYPLAFVDKLARIDSTQQQSLKSRLYFSLPDEVKAEANALNFHDRLME